MNPSKSNNTNNLLLNKHKVSSSFMKQDFSNFYQQFMPKSRLNNSFINKQNQFYVYDPNEEDKDIGKFSANIVNPEEIKRILGLD